MEILGFLFFLLVLWCLWHVCIMAVTLSAFAVAFIIFIGLLLAAIVGAF